MAIEEWNEEVQKRLSQAIIKIFKEIRKEGSIKIKQNIAKRIYIIKDETQPNSFYNTRPISIISFIRKIYDFCLNTQLKNNL